MAWNPSPQVAAARDFGKRFGAPQVVILFFDKEHDGIGYASWGATKALCDETGMVAEELYNKAIEIMCCDVDEDSDEDENVEEAI